MKKFNVPTRDVARFVLLAALLVFAFVMPGNLNAKVNECGDYLKPLCPGIDKMVGDTIDMGVSVAVMLPEGKMSAATFNETPEGQPITPDMLFEIGSITKSFTAARIMQLIETGAFTLDTSLSDLLPANEVFYTSKIPGNVTIRQLLNLNTGFDDYMESFQVIENNLAEFWPMRNMTSAGFYKNDPKLGELCYCSTNSLLLGLVIDKLNGGNGTTKEPLVESYREHLFKPAGLKNTYFGGYEHKFPISSCTNVNYSGNIPPGECKTSGTRCFTGNGTASNDSHIAYSSMAGPAGGLISTAADIARWFHWLFNNGPGEKMVASPLLIGEMHSGDKTPVTWYKCGQSDNPWPFIGSSKVQMGYAIQILTNQYEKKTVKIYSFLGGTLSFNGYVFYLPEYRKSCAILVNNFNDASQSIKMSTTEAIMKIAGLIIQYMINGDQK